MSAAIKQVTVTAPDISCAHCVATVQKTVGALPGVQSVTANADSKQVAINFNPSEVSLAQIETAMDEAGYPIQQ